jgi:hypothetical protein
VDDGTDGLRQPGIVAFVAPPVAPRPRADVLEGSGRRITVAGATGAAAFRPGDRVVIAGGESPEVAVVGEARGDRLALRRPLAGTFAGGTVSLAPLPRFGAPRDWVRVRLAAPGAPPGVRLRGVHLNATRAVQVRTIEGEVLGSGNGEPGQAVFFSQAPVLPGEEVEVRELEGPRAAVEWPVLRADLRRLGFPEDAARLATDARNGRVVGVWVRWQSRPHLFFSGPDDRHYVLERATGRLRFGDGARGRLPSAGPNGIRARRYRSGGGAAGNVPAGSITQVLSAAPPVEGVANPRPAEGGAGAESVQGVRWRGPQTLRHRGRALSAADCEALAREASPGVAAARALPATAPDGRPAPGWLTVVIVPRSRDPRPQPSRELRQLVRAYLAARAPATLPAGRVAVVGPAYLPLGAAARVVPRDPARAGAVGRDVRATLEAFLHPVSGGPAAGGWPFGRDAYLSDVAAVLAGVEGIDYAEELELLLDGVPAGERVAVPPDRIVAAGPVRVEVGPPARCRP